MITLKNFLNIRIITRFFIPLIVCITFYKYVYIEIISNPEKKNILNKEADITELFKNSICLEKDESFDNFLIKLKNKNKISNPEYLSFVRTLRGGNFKVFGGCYLLNKDTTPLELIKSIEKAEFVIKKFEVKPEYYLDYLDFVLKKNSFIKERKAFINEFYKNKEIYEKQFGVHNNLEGRIFSKTYELPLYYEASSIIKILLNDSINIWNRKFRKQVKDNKLSKNKILTIASIISIEVKSKNKQKLKQLARKIIKDAKENKHLAYDSILIYRFNLKDKLTEKEKEIAYKYFHFDKRKGLPSGPIGAPTEEAVQITIDALVEYKNNYF